MDIASSLDISCTFAQWPAARRKKKQLKTFTTKSRSVWVVSPQWSSRTQTSASSVLEAMAAWTSTMAGVWVRMHCWFSAKQVSARFTSTAGSTSPKITNLHRTLLPGALKEHGCRYKEHLRKQHDRCGTKCCPTWLVTSTHLRGKKTDINDSNCSSLALYYQMSSETFPSLEISNHVSRDVFSCISALRFLPQAQG